MNLDCISGKEKRSPKDSISLFIRLGDNTILTPLYVNTGPVEQKVSDMKEKGD